MHSVSIRTVGGRYALSELHILIVSKLHKNSKSQPSNKISSVQLLVESDISSFLFSFIILLFPQQNHYQRAMHGKIIQLLNQVRMCGV